MTMKILKIAHHIGRSLEKVAHKAKPNPVLTSVVIIAVGVVVAGGILYDWKALSFSWFGNLFRTQNALPSSEVKAKTERFIASSNLSGGKQVEVKEISDAGEGLYKVMVQLEGGQGLIESFVTKDGKIFFPQGISIEDVK